MLKVPGQGNQSIHPAQQRRQNPQQQFEGHEEYAYKVHPSNWMEILSFQQVHLHPRSGSRTMNGNRINVGIVGDLQPGLNSKTFLGRNHQDTETCGFTTRSDFRQNLFFCSGSCFSLAGNFQLPGNRTGEREQKTFPHCMYRHKHFVTHDVRR